MTAPDPATRDAGSAAVDPRLDGLRRRIEHEDNLINQRLSWLVGSQAFLVSALAISLNAPATLAPRLAALHQALVDAVPWLALICIVILWATLAGALGSLARLRAEADRLSPSSPFPIYSPASIRHLGLSAPLLIPGVFLVFWIVLLLQAP